MWLLLTRASLTSALLLIASQTSQASHARGCEITAKILEKDVKRKCLENEELRGPSSKFIQGCRDAAYFAGFSGTGVWRGCEALEALEAKGLLK